ncbi:MAG: hypothetical protein QOF76_5594, partial [Solirubrobacteraceae bacterium]|nr:hypothetical protein [Solirubrobacteraceae bacterium]
APRYRSSPVESLMSPPLTTGEKVSEADLDRGAQIISANDAAYDLAYNHGDHDVSAFVAQMNARAQQLGLKNTSYANPIGLDDPNNYSTARDLAALTRKLEEFPFFNTTVDTQSTQLQSRTQQPTLYNRNILLGPYPWVDGVKTGTTLDAGSVLVASGVRKQGTHLIAIVMGADTKAAAAAQVMTLFKYGFGRYQVKTAIQDGDPVVRVPIEDRPGAELPLVATMTVKHLRLKRGPRFTFTTHAPKKVAGPIGIHQHIGTIDVSLDGKLLATVPLETTLRVPKAGPARKTQDFLTHPWILGVLGAILLGGSLVASRRKKPPRPRREKEVA